MESILKITGTEIWIGSFLFSSGLEGPAYAAKLREAEELVHAMEEQYEAGYNAGHSEGYDIGYDEGEAISAPEPPTQSTA